MNKYIDAEKLIAEIERRKDEWQVLINKNNAVNPTAAKEVICEDLNILDIITSLQQEQPESTCKTCGFYENNCPFIRGKLIPYPNRICKDYTYSDMKEQEQSEVDLEKEIDNVIADYSFAKTIDSGGFKTTILDYAKIARHFYNLGLNARK